MNVGLLIGIVYALGWGISVPFAWRIMDLDLGEPTDEPNFGEFTAHGLVSLLVALFWPLAVGIGAPAWIAYQFYLRWRKRF